MLTVSNTTTRRLEGYARNRGLDLGILKSPQNSAGVYFIATDDGRVLSRWVSLGWTVAEAEEAIERRAAGATPVPSQSGYVSHQ